MSHDYRLAATLRLGWDDMHRDCLALAERLRPVGPFKGIVAVARGGLVPAAILARELDCPLVETVCIASYDGRVQGGLTVLKDLPGDDGAGWLVVDDLVDSGATAAVVRAMLPKAHFATLYAKPAGRALVDTFVAEMDQEVWIVFPWEAAPVTEDA
ncbi:MAG: xanthine phosphoribosyltransferase [Solirubrobacterales bacterium]